MLALGSVVSALLSPYGLWVCVAEEVWERCAGIGLLNGLAITWLNVPPFICSLAAMLVAQGTTLYWLITNRFPCQLATRGSNDHGSGNILGFPIPCLDLRQSLLSAWIGICLNFTATGRYVLAIGGNEEAARLMGLPVDRVKLFLYLLSGLLSGLSGVILAAQFGAGQPTEGVGWELFAIASVVVGGTLLSGGQGSVGATLAGVLLLGLIFNILNFENGLGWISLSAYWQSVIRGVFLMIVVIFQSRLVVRQRVAR